MNASALERIGRIFPPIFRPPVANSQEIATVASSSNPMEMALSINPRYAAYYNHLSLAGHGTPLWLPEPNETRHINYRRRGAAIGDVVFFTANGAMDFLFNICLDAHDPINDNNVPEGFLAFQPALTSNDIRRSQEYGEDSYLASKSITKKRDRMGPAGLWFQSSASEGAILAMPEGAYSEDLARVSGFDRYLAENLDSWYYYVNEIREWGVKQGELHLITGVHKAKAWGIATFSNERTTANDLKMVFKPSEDTSSGAQYCWEFEGVVDSSRAGPTRRQRRIIFEGLDNAEREQIENQCLFVRTANATIRKPDSIKDREMGSLFVSTSQAHNMHSPDLELSGSAGQNHFSSSHGRHNTNAHDTSILGQLGAQDSLSITRNGPVLRDHPSKAINDFLLKERPNGRIVITHDRDWISLLTSEDLFLPSGDEFVERLKKSCKILEDKGVISLEYKVSQSDMPTRKGKRKRALHRRLRSFPAEHFEHGFSGINVAQIVNSIPDDFPPQGSVSTTQKESTMQYLNLTNEAGPEATNIESSFTVIHHRLEQPNEDAPRDSVAAVQLDSPLVAVDRSRTGPLGGVYRADLTHLTGAPESHRISG